MLELSHYNERMTILIIVFVLFSVLQILLNIYAYFSRHSLRNEYGFTILSLIEPATALENYVKIFRSVDVKVNAKIKEPAIALKEFVLINKKLMYANDLYTNYYLLFQLELSKRKNSFIRNAQSYLGISFTIGCAVFMASLILIENKEIFAIIAIAIQLCTIFFSIVTRSLFDEIIKEVDYIAYDLLNLDEKEQYSAHQLGSKIKSVTFEYPIFVLGKMVGFLVPRRR